MSILTKKLAIIDGKDTDNQLSVSGIDYQRLYAGVDKDERNDFMLIERQWNDTNRDFFVRIGGLLNQVRSLIKSPGAHSGLTFEKWLKYHGIGKTMAYQAMNAAKEYNRIQLMNDPNKEEMLSNFLTLPKELQDQLGKGQVDENTEKLLLHTKPEQRNSVAWQNAVDELANNRKKLSKQNDQISELLEKNRALTKQIAESESKRANLTEELAKATDHGHHLELQLEDEKSKGPEYVQVPPDNYYDLSNQINQLENELDEKNELVKQLQSTVDSSVSPQVVKKSEAMIKKLKSSNRDLSNQIKNLNAELRAKNEELEKHSEAYRKVALVSSTWLTFASKQLDVEKLIPDLKGLSAEEISQLGLEDLADTLADKSKKLHDELKEKGSKITE